VEIIDYLKAFRQYWRSCLLILIVAVGIGVVLLYTLPKTYTADSRVFVTVVVGNSGSDLASGTNYSQNQVDSFAEVAVSPMVLDPVIEKLGLNLTAAQLTSKIGVRVRDGTSVMVLSATDANGEVAADIANALAESLIEAVKDLSPTSSDGDKLVWATIITKASPPRKNAFPPTTTTLLLAGLAGVLIAVVQAVVRTRMDKRIRTDADIAKVTDVPVVAHIGLDKELERPDADQLAVSGLVGEDYRRLRTNLQFLGGEKTDRGKAFVITSALPSEGKTTVSVNLCRMLAEAGETTLLIDADLRNPTVGPRLGLTDAVGLSSLLINRVDLRDVLHATSTPGFTVLPAGEVPPNPSELLSSDMMRRFLTEACGHFNYVIVDTPPLLPVTDAAVLARESKGALVVTAEGTTLPQLAEALNSVAIAKGEVVGIVLNKVHRDPKRYGSKYGYGYYYGATKGAAKQSG
jgi:capsular exopolysaccharide synthesis family protein